MKPRVSVIIPVRNAAATIQSSIKSVLDQDFKDIEVIVVVNGTTDRTVDKVLEINDDRIKLFESEAGIVPALNRGIHMSSGEIIARQDADDIWMSGKLSNQIRAFDEGLGDVIGTQMRVVQAEKPDTITEYPKTHAGILEWFGQIKNPIGHPSVAMKRSALDKVGGYWDFFPFAEDFDLWMRMLPYVRFANLEMIGVQYNFVPNPRYSHEVPKFLIRHYASLYRAEER